MVWLHGGGFSQGAASAPVYDGTNLAKRGDVVVVGVNHRLNVLGYAYLGELGGPDFAKSGNAGILDLVQALEWVRDNIERFGGDPKNVMIFGESGGGAKVSTLLAMPCAKGLFHRAAIESGPGIRALEREQATKIAEGLLTQLALKPGQVRELQKLPLERLMTAYFATGAAMSSGTGRRGFAPVVDGDALPRHPFSPDAPPVSADVPILIGYNRTEAEFFLLADRGAKKMTEDDLKRRVKPLFGDNGQRVIDLYRKASPGLSPYELCVLIQTDSGMGLNSIRLAERKAAAGRALRSISTTSTGTLPRRGSRVRTRWRSRSCSTTSKSPNSSRARGPRRSTLQIGSAMPGPRLPARATPTRRGCLGGRLTIKRIARPC